METADAQIGSIGPLAGEPERVGPVEPPQSKTPVAEPVPEREPPEQETPIKDLRQVVDVFTQAAELLNRAVRFQIDESTDRLVAQVVNVETNEVIRQIPPEELMRLARRLREFIGILLDIEI